MYLKQLVIASLIFISTSSLLAQEGGGNTTPSGDAISFHMGPYLPKNFETVDDILKVIGLRYSLQRNQGSYYELGLSFSNTDSHRYQELALSLRQDLPLADFTGFALAGLNLHRLQPADKNDYKYHTGIHAGGGILGHIASTTFLRLEMRANLMPGTVLFFGFGLEVHFGGGG